MSDAERANTAALPPPDWEDSRIWGDDGDDGDNGDDGDAFDASDCPECGSTNVDWSDDGYYCMHCGGVGR